MPNSVPTLKQAGAAGDHNRKSSCQRGYDRKWQKARAAFLLDNPWCMYIYPNGDTCRNPATEVDHRTPHANNPSLFWDHANWQPICRDCHIHKTRIENKTPHRRTGTGRCKNVIVVCGPPGSGKTHYVNTHRQWGDLVIDFDLLMQAISGELMYHKPASLLRHCAAARDALYSHIEKDSADIRCTWIVTSAPTAKERDELQKRFGAKVIVLNVSMGECIKRIANDDRRVGTVEDYQTIVNKWFRDYEREGTCFEAVG